MVLVKADKKAKKKLTVELTSKTDQNQTQSLATQQHFTDLAINHGYLVIIHCRVVL